jgi:uncharacterized protein (TIGR00369 family)
MDPQDPNALERVRARFGQAAFIRDLGIELHDLGPGWCEMALNVSERHFQADGFVHAGVQATMADHGSGTAAATLVAPGDIILTAEFKINLLRPAVGDRLTCRAEILKPGRRLMVAETRVWANRGGQSSLTAIMIATLAVTRP